MLLHSDSLITGGVFRKPRWVSSMAETCGGEQTRPGEAGGAWKVTLSCVWWGVPKASDWWLRTLHILIGNEECLTSCSGAGYDKTSVWKRCSNLCSKDIEGRDRERQRERRFQREIHSRQGYYLGTFWLSEKFILPLLWWVAMETWEKRWGAKSEFNGRTNMGLLENGLEIGFFKLWLERYVTDFWVSWPQRYLYFIFHSLWPVTRATHKNSCYSFSVVVSPQ